MNIVMEQMIIQNPMNFPPFNEGECVSNWSEQNNSDLPKIYYEKYNIRRYTTDYGISWHIIENEIIENKGKDRMIIFPNPAKDTYLSIETNIGNDEQVVISITDLKGKKVKEYNFNNSKIIQIDISDISKGVYIISILSNKSIITDKLIIK
jgi:hypothetical protein